MRDGGKGRGREGGCENAWALKLKITVLKLIANPLMFLDPENEATSIPKAVLAANITLKCFLDNHLHL